MSCRDEILEVVTFLTAQRRSNTFTVGEVVTAMLARNTTYAPGTISRHIRSRMCVNGPQKYATQYQDFRRIRPGLYEQIEGDSCS